MKPYYQSDNLTLYCSDVLDALRELPSESVHMCVTSPPYYGLRDYGTAEWEGGDVECRHTKGDGSPKSRAKSTLHGFAESQGHNLESWGDRCHRCGAVRVDKQIGLEARADCGKQKFVRLRSDLSKDQILYVARRLMDAGLLGDGNHGNGDKE